MISIENAPSIGRQWLDLSSAQRAVWLDVSLTESPTAYIRADWAKLQGVFDTDAARQALTLVVARHDALRLRVDDELPRQWLHTATDVPLSVTDLSGEGDPDEALQAHLKLALNKKLPMGDHWLFLFDIAKLGDRDFYLLLRCHHLLVDEAAASLLLIRWFEAYQALTSDSAPELSPPTSYLPVIAADTTYKESSRYKQDLDYWLQQFKSLSPQLMDLTPLSPAANDEVPITAGFMVEGDRYAAFLTLSTRMKLTPQRLLFALTGIVLGRRYGQSDITMGMALHGRDASHLYTIGMLAGIVPVRFQLPENFTLAEAIQAVSARIERDLRHQRLPLDVISRELSIARGGLSELFQVAFSFLPADRHHRPLLLDGLRIQFGSVASREASPLTVHALELAGQRGIQFGIAAHRNLIETAEVDRLLSLFETTLDLLLDDAEEPLDRVPCLTSAEQVQVIAEWNRTTAIYPRSRAEALFQRQAQQTPQTIAVLSATESLTYAELDRRSTQLAHLLLSQGVRPQQAVGVALKRSVSTVVSLLAILKAGAIYLPLDPSYPVDRLAYLCSDSEARHVITDEAIANSLPDDVQRVFPDQADTFPGVPLPARLNDNEAAYIIYTSGSTGKPKGVVVPHSAAVNLAFGRLQHDPIGVGDRILAAISVGFDVSIGQLLLPLLSGATIVIASDMRTLTPQEFWSFLATHQVTHINSVPSFFESILDAAPRSSSLSRLMLGGEPLASALVRRLHQTLPQTRVFNMYGPTEACIDATFYEATSAEGAAMLPIGRPLPNYRAYILNDQLEPLGIGVAGDLYLAGAGLAHGYLHQAALTAEGFVANPFSQAGDRLYLTGDRARWRSDGQIEFLGRADKQVKIRGHRIELGEVEAAALHHPAVSQAVVIAQQDRVGQARLIAYLVLHPDMDQPDNARLRSHFATHIPEYMIPAAFLTIPALPLTTNGKLDLGALPPVDWQAQRVFVAPRTEAEKAVAGLFAEVLNIDQAGATDHFFELGGHSLLAARLVSQLRTQLDIHISLRTLFEQPTVEAIAQHRSTGLAVAFQILPRPEFLPLSFTQERLWFLSQLLPDDTYNVPISVRLEGPLDVLKASQTIKEIVRRHEALRTLVVMRDGKAWQSIQPADRFAVPLESSTDLAHHVFDLSSELPIRVEIASVSPTDHLLSAVIHHSVFDGWSAQLFLREFAQLYLNIPLPPLETQYADFAVWQRQQDFSAQIAYWKDRLAGAPPALELPTDHAPAPFHRRAAASAPLAISPTLHAELLSLAHAGGASLFMLLHAALVILLARWSGQKDVVIGTVVANRTFPEWESLIGCFVNTIPLRTEVNPLHSFRQILASVREADLAAYEHQDVPFERLVEELQPERSLHRTPLFEVMLVLQNEALEQVELPGLQFHPEPTAAGVAKFNLTWNLEPDAAGGLSGSLEYASDLFDASTCLRLADQWHRLLLRIATNPDQRPMQADLLSSWERQQVVSAWNQTSVVYPTGRAEYLFAQQSRRTPAALAVFSKDDSLTYAELDSRSSQLAHALQQAGVQPQAAVGVALQRSVSTVIALLAVLKAGAVYLPLDPAYPSQRLAHMCSDSGAQLVVTTRNLADSIPTGLPCLFVDQPETFLHLPTTTPIIHQTERDTAYIIYTSGSTGQPKGVAVPHAAAVNLAYARLQHDPIGPGDRILAAISVGFDVSLGQLLLPLLSGATIAVADDLRMFTPAKFWSFLETNQVTHINSVPSFFESILDSAPRVTSLRRLMLGGERLSSTLVRRLHQALPQTEVFNLYGPTEACIDAICYAVKREEDAAFVPIGRPLPNYQTYILDEFLNPVPVGVAGDLYLAGTGLAHGYLHQPALTAERFVANPFDSSGQRLYNTGDRACWRSDGEIDFRGRLDTQVKVRGHRIELNEIESAILQQTGVREAAVVVRDERIFAYFVSDRPIAADELRVALSQRLPDYMVPAAFIALTSVPLTPNGKLDRNALPSPNIAELISRPFASPEGETEQKLAAAFCSVLKLNAVSRYDHFFELGGHSLLAMTLIARLKDAGLHANVRDVFTSPTVADLAALLIQSVAAVEAPPNLIPPDAQAITPAMLSLVNLSQEEIDSVADATPGGSCNIQDIYPLAPLQEGILFHHLMSETGDAYLTPFLLGFDAQPRLQQFLQSLQQVIDRHDILRTAFVWEKLAEPLQNVWRKAYLLSEEVAVQAGEDVALQLRQRFDPTHFRIDVRQAPLLRAYFAEDKAQHRWLLMLLTHHLILDHTSLGTLLREIHVIGDGLASSLPAAVPFRHFVAQARLAVPQSEHEEFFRQMLSDVDETTCPFGLQRLQKEGAAIREATVILSAERSQRIRNAARTCGVGPATLFHLAWALVLAHVSARRDVVFGTLLIGRVQSGQHATNTLGLFINTLPLRIRVDGTGVAEALKQTQTLLAGLLRHENASLALAQRCSGVAAPAPLFSSLFNYRQSPGAESGQTGLPGVELVFAQERTDYPVAVAVDDLSDSFSITAQADSPVDPDHLCRYLETALEQLLAALQSSPGKPLELLAVLPSDQREQVLDGWNGTAAAYPIATVHELFAQQVAKAPGITAVISGEGSLSYAELDRRAEQLADHLFERGIRPQSVVGVEMPRSLSTVVAAMAILKAGAIYLPLDPAYPRERLAHMVADAGAELVLTNIEHPQAGPRNPVAVTPGQTAYIIYTSGSTGKPKGVAVPHSAAVNLAFARQTHDPIANGDRVLGAISVGFDVSIGQLLLPLLSGATVVIADDLRTFTPHQFWQFIDKQQVSHINSVPSFFESILPAAPRRTSLRRLMLGGEALSSALAVRLKQALPATELFNMYGPTETCIDATVYPATGSDNSLTLPIGKPLPNYRAYVLDRFLQPVGSGVEGDLYLSGAGLAHGYLNQPALTAERFIADPFQDSGERLYQSGDRARWRQDGQIEFLGRADTQVKIRGHRIELGEIEAALLQQPGVRESAVVIHQIAPGDERLIGYYTAAAAVAAETLQQALSQILPAYMVPAAFIWLAALPLTPNGKLDRKALPAPDPGFLTRRLFEPPQTAAEQKLATLFESVLNVKSVSRHDHFFELGGHSLLAMALIGRLQQAGLSINIRDLFTTPTVAALAQQLSKTSGQVEIPPNRIAAGANTITPDMLPLVSLSQPEIDLITAATPGGVSNIQDIYPLAPLQEGILFHHLISTVGDAYLAPFIVSFDQPWRLQLFTDTLQELVLRHDILRTSVQWEGLSEPLQVVLREASLSIQPLTLHPDEDAVTQLRNRFNPQHFRLDVRRAPMLRAYTAEDQTNHRWLLMLMSHHLILDHTSMEIMLHEIGLIASGRRSDLPPTTAFRQFVAQARLGIPTSEHEKFFGDMLGDVDEPTSPYALQHVQNEGVNIRESRLTLDSSLSRRLRNQVRLLGVGPATFFHLAWALVLAHIASRRDVVFGTLLLGRLQGADFSRTMGLFINTLPIRFKIDSTGVQEAIQKTQQLLAHLLRHENASLALAQRSSGVPAPAPLFSSLFNYRQNPPAAAGSQTGLPGVNLVFAQERTDYPVALAIDDFTDEFAITAQTDEPVDPADVCQLMNATVFELLSALENSPDTALSEIRVLPLDACLQITRAWNETDATNPVATLHSLFEQQVARTPDAIAAVSSDGSLTYAELNTKAELFANRLAAEGIGLQSVVGVEMQRSASTIIAAVAILKQGAIYLPLDPAYPRERLAHMVADAGAELVLTDIKHPPAAPRHPVAVTADQTAYIIYTSGSTGKPKGVAVSHAAAVNLAFARHAHDPIGPGDRVLAAISVGFDVSIGQLLLPLLSGATVVIAGDVRSMLPDQFWNFLEAHQITHINSVPSFFESILEAAPESSSLVRLMLGGEPLSSTLIKRLKQALPKTEVFNMYGPTEACIDATWYPAKASDTAAILPIGKPLPNYRAYILDVLLNPVAIGVAGDLYLAGAGLAHGYLRQPALTAQRFIANPFGAAGERLYHTGDRARWRSDGQIEFLGRVDTQVKIRGHRIELGEIESALLTHPSVAQAVVVIQTERLIGYLVQKTLTATDVLRDYLLKQLPDYMVPSEFITLKAIPLTAHGKIDFKALPQVATDRSAKGAYQPPRTETECRMQTLWQRILSVEPIGIQDDFFALGGHSLSVMRLIGACNSTFDLNLGLSSLFENPTIANLAAVVDARSQSTADPSLVALRAAGNRPPLFCIHAAGGAVFPYLPLARALNPDQPVYGVQARSLVSDQSPAETIAQAATDYIQVLRSVQHKGPYQLLGWSAGGMLAYEMAQQLKSLGEPVSLLCLLDTYLPDLAKANPPEATVLHDFAHTMNLQDLLSDHNEDFLERVWQSRRLPEEISLQQLHRFYAEYRNTLHIYPHYSPVPWDGPLLLFCTPQTPRWDSLMASNACYIQLDCTHADFASEQLAPVLARHLESCLEKEPHGSQRRLGL